MLRDHQVRVEHLLTHRVAPDDAPQIYEMIRTGGDDWLAILFDWSHDPGKI